jgi:radical SAM/Cys-rich protein
MMADRNGNWHGFDIESAVRSRYAATPGGRGSDLEQIMTAHMPVTPPRGSIDQDILQATGGELRASSLQVIQVNIGLRCNLACRHCHLECSPKRTEQMDWSTMELVLKAAQRADVRTLDITGGAPEMHPHFRRFVCAAHEIGLTVIVRTNLTVMLQEGQCDLPEFFRDKRVQLVASMPCYLEENVDQQRGKHVHADSVAVIKQLNKMGYGVEEALCLDLVYNPLAPTLPPPQGDLEDTYRRELGTQYGIRFTNLRTITNMPIGRFLKDVQRQRGADEYRKLLSGAFNVRTVEGLMCRHQIMVGYDGTIYDCDFNLALTLPVSIEAGRNISRFNPATLMRRRITTGQHCYGCTAGSGSSCGGALV